MLSFDCFCCAGELFGLTQKAWEDLRPAEVADLSPEATETILRVYSQDFSSFGYSRDPGQFKLPPSGGVGYVPGGHALKADFAQKLHRPEYCKDYKVAPSGPSQRCWGYSAHEPPNPNPDSLLRGIGTSEWAPQEVISAAAAARSQLQVRSSAATTAALSRCICFHCPTGTVLYVRRSRQPCAVCF